jgi:hypothetical protein
MAPDAPPPAFEPVRVLLERYQLAICRHIPGLGFAEVVALPWWQFRQACDLVDLIAGRGDRG